jgi:hypothetical protein
LKALAQEAKKSANDPVDVMEMDAIVTRLKRYGFTSVRTVRVENNWQVTVAMSPKPSPAKLKAAPATAPVKNRPVEWLAGTKKGTRGELVEANVGVSDYLEPKKSPPGWNVIKDGRDVPWVQAHLLNGKLGGPGEAWNLVVAPTGVNNNMRTVYESTVVPDARRGAKYWFKAQAQYRTEGDNQAEAEKLKAINPAFRVSDFARAITVWYAKRADAAGRQVNEPAVGHSFPVRLPKDTEIDPIHTSD